MLTIIAAAAAFTFTPNPLFAPGAPPLFEEPQPTQAPDPTDSYIRLAESSIRSELKDPSSAQFKWPYGFSLYKKKDLWTCGLLNARNSYGGYGGDTWVLVTFRDGALRRINYADPGVRGDYIAVRCEQAARKGELTPR
jgi:hypothetical protein